MKLNFCTLFDFNYLSRGLVMYESLLNNCSDFHLYIYAFDNICLDILNQLSLKNTTVISLIQFEDQKLLEVKKNRSSSEYCWTCTPSVILYSIENFNLSLCTYLDADLYFYSNPEVLIMEMGNNSVLITEHRYTSEYDQSEKSGIYCVQFLTIKNDPNGMKVIRWWRNACIDWCYARYEEGKFGDQKYLDNWPSSFEGIYVLKNLGGGLAPWNIQQYNLFNQSGQLKGKTINNKKEFQVIFHHFHYLKFYKNNIVTLTVPYQYKILKEHRYHIYFPYIENLQIMENKLYHFENYKQNLPISALRPKTFFRKLLSCGAEVLKCIKKSEYRYLIKNVHTRLNSYNVYYLKPLADGKIQNNK